MYITSQLTGKGYKDSDYTIVIAIVWLADGTDINDDLGHTLNFLYYK